MLTYNQFIKEQNSFVITLANVNDVIKRVFNDTKVQSVKTLYEKDGDGFKLIITLNEVYYEKTSVILTKLIFYVNKDKTKLLRNEFSYLKEINDVYKNVGFTDIDDLTSCIKGIFHNNKFGTDLKDLSVLNVLLTSQVNSYLSSDNISVYNISYEPKVDNMPSDKMVFNYKINVNNSDELSLNIKKLSNEFEISISCGDWFEKIDTPSVKSIPQSISELIKKRYK